MCGRAYCGHKPRIDDGHAAHRRGQRVGRGVVRPDAWRQWREVPMMTRFYVVPSATLAAHPPVGSWAAHSCPDDPATSMVVVDNWSDTRAQDVWEALPDVTEIHIEQMG